MSHLRRVNYGNYRRFCWTVTSTRTPIVIEIGLDSAPREEQLPNAPLHGEVVEFTGSNLDYHRRSSTREHSWIWLDLNHVASRRQNRIEMMAVRQISSVPTINGNAHKKIVS